jgi:hypothetical protein
LIKRILENVVKVAPGRNRFIEAQYIGLLNKINTNLTYLTHGKLNIDLRPWGDFLRELHAIEHAKKTYIGASNADPSFYWLGTTGTMSLARNEAAIRRGVEVTRYFIHPRAKFADPELRKAIDANIKIGVQVLVIDSTLIESLLERDFGICDDGSIVFELILDERKIPMEVEHHFGGVDMADEAIRKLKNVWRDLSIRAKPANEILND